MENLKTIKKIISKIQQENNVNVCENIDQDSNLFSDLGLDSFMLAQLTVEIEEKFGVDIFEDSIVTSVSEILNKLK